MEINNYSDQIWSLSPPKIEELKHSLKDKDFSIYLTSSWEINHDRIKKISKSSGENSVILSNF